MVAKAYFEQKKILCYCLSRNTQLVSKILLRTKFNALLAINCVTCYPEVESRTQGSRPRTQKNFEAKDRPSRGQGPRTQTQDFSKKKKGLQKFFSGKKGLQKIFSGDLYLRKPKKRSSQIFRKVSGVFQRNFNDSKIVLSSNRRQAIFEDLRLRGQ